MRANANYRGRRVSHLLAISVISALSVAIRCHAADAAEQIGGVMRSSSQSGQYSVFVNEAVSRFGIPARWIDAIIATESFGDATATSPKGAMGLMQIMPQTWADLRGRYTLGANPYDPHDNILAGAAYLRELYGRYGWGGFLAAYNAGPGRYEEYLATGRALPPETVTYITRVSSLIGEGSAQHVGLLPSSSPSWATSRLFTVRGESKLVAAQTTAIVPVDRTPAAQKPQPSFRLAPQSAGLFVLLSRKGAQP